MAGISDILGKLILSAASSKVAGSLNPPGWPFMIDDKWGGGNGTPSSPANPTGPTLGTGAVPADPNATPTVGASPANPNPATASPSQSNQNAIDQILRAPVLNPPAPKRSALDYLLMAGLPLAQGFIASKSGRRIDAGRNFAAGLVSGGANVAANEAQRPEKIQEAQRQQAIDRLLLGAKLQGALNKPETSVHPIDVMMNGKPTTIDAISGKVLGTAVPKEKTQPAPKTLTQTLPDGSTQEYQVDESGNATPITIPQPSEQSPLIPGLQTPQPGAPFASAPKPKATGGSEFDAWREAFKADKGRYPNTAEIDAYHRAPVGEKPATKDQLANVEKDKSKAYQSLEDGYKFNGEQGVYESVKKDKAGDPAETLTPQEWDQRKQAIEDEYRNRLQALGVDTPGYTYPAGGQPANATPDSKDPFSLLGPKPPAKGGASLKPSSFDPVNGTEPVGAKPKPKGAPQGRAYIGAIEPRTPPPPRKPDTYIRDQWLKRIRTT